VRNPRGKHASFEAKGKLRCLKCLFVRIKAFMKATTRIDAFFIYALPLPYVECRAPKFLVDPLEGPSMRQCGRSWN